MWRKTIQPVLAVLILAATVIVFIHYFSSHKEVRHQLSHLSLSLILLILALYILTLGAIALVNVATLKLCRVKVSKTENFLITAYTAVVNFFGPLQSGPAVRAVYLKKRYDMDLKKYATATVVYYLCWAIFSGIFLLSGLLKWWLIPLSLIGLLCLFFITKLKVVSSKVGQLDMKYWYLVALATLLQICLVTLIYYTELHKIDPAIHFNQAVIYTGAANFALFVSLTPGAIGFRETFLVFSERLHHISSSTIIAANIIDRSVYILFLLLTAAIIVFTHAGRLIGERTRPPEQS